MKKKILFAIASILSLGISVFALAKLDTFTISAKAEECEYHHGYHYAQKDPTIDEAGHLEFWACCTCGHQYLEKPNGEFVDRDDAYMIGVIDENHIAYLQPATSGGSNGDYWTNDPFDED